MFNIKIQKARDFSIEITYLTFLVNQVEGKTIVLTFLKVIIDLPKRNLESFSRLGNGEMSVFPLWKNKTISFPPIRRITLPL